MGLLKLVCLLPAVAGLAGPSSQHADRATVLLNRVVRTLGQTRSFESQMYDPASPGDKPTEVRFLRPDRLLLLMPDAKAGDSVVLVQGDRVLTYTPRTRTGQWIARGSFVEFSGLAPAYFVACTLLEPLLYRTLPPPKYAGTSRHGGRIFQVIKFPAAPDRGAISLYIGAGGLPEGVEIGAVRTASTQIPAQRAWHRNVRLNAPLEAARCAFTPPADAKLETPEDELEAVPPVGAPAPSFQVALVNGRQVNLESLLKGRKALLLNFTFYG